MAAAILQARMSSTRLPGKVMRPLAGRPMIERQIERLRPCATLDRLIVATSDDASDDPLAEHLAGMGVEVFRGSLHDVLDRYVGAARACGARGVIVRLTADCPLADPEVIDDCVRLRAERDVDYASNGLRRTYPRGLDVEAFNVEALLAAHREAADPYDREHVTPFLYRRPDRYRLGNVKSPDNHGEMRWTVDTEADFRMVDAVYRELLSPNKTFGYADILDLLARRPDIAAINAPTAN